MSASCRPLRFAVISAPVLHLVIASTPAQTTLSLAPIQDTYVQDTNPTHNFGTSDELWLGKGVGFGLGKIRTLVEFDLTPLPHGNVHKATFSAWQFDTEPAAGAIACKLFRCTADWVESLVTWSAQPDIDGTKAWSTAGVGDSSDLGWIDWEVTELVHEQVANNLANHGWMLRVDFESSGISRLGYFRSREYADVPSQRPKLVVELYDLDLEVGPLVAGGATPLVVKRATPGSGVFVAYDLTGLGATPLVRLGVVLELHFPQLLAFLTADSFGEASIDLHMPASASGIPFWLQAAAVGKRSNVQALVSP